MDTEADPRAPSSCASPPAPLPRDRSVHRLLGRSDSSATRPGHAAPPPAGAERRRPLARRVRSSARRAGPERGADQGAPAPEGARAAAWPPVRRAPLSVLGPAPFSRGPRVLSHRLATGPVSRAAGLFPPPPPPPPHLKTSVKAGEGAWRLRPAGKGFPPVVETIAAPPHPGTRGVQGPALKA